MASTERCVRIRHRQVNNIAGEGAESTHSAACKILSSELRKLGEAHPGEAHATVHITHGRKLCYEIGP